jgi:hypothetical protein
MTRAEQKIAAHIARTRRSNMDRAAAKTAKRNATIKSKG